ncbi:hypothetical protein LGT39_00700 [Demequina sp. TTPB684]|uniref:hypothetical protein n=1 Tax=unclassified Demequina TaxID=2620311 RepID=UPI001CF5638C|nr:MULTISPECIES: hypothetical protein [unclassified Demequina]MCB2411363.1 hypothetical protein [Demequina sp. TTPB684]UPU88068.1 hypothetical protein LGT36_012590 [Demequina sp. TMPB413]
MSKDQPTPDAVVAQATELTKSDDMQSRIYQAISIQRPVVIEYLKSLRRDKPDATPAEILDELGKRYVRTVTITSTGVGASAAIPAVGIPLALGLGVGDLLFFYETSALYVLAATELHGIEVRDAERARPLVFGMLLGQKSQSKVTALVLEAAGAGGVNRARTVARGTVGKALPTGWGEVLTQQLPDSALAPLATVMAREALKASGMVGARTLGKAIPFGLGAIVGGVGSFTFGRDVVKAMRLAFPVTPTVFPDALVEFRKPAADAGAGDDAGAGGAEASRAVRALQAAAGGASAVGAGAWGKVTGAAGAVSGAAGAVGSRLKRRKST